MQIERGSRERRGRGRVEREGGEGERGSRERRGRGGEGVEREGGEGGEGE